MPSSTHSLPDEATVRRNAFGVLGRQQEAALLRAARRLCRERGDSLLTETLDEELEQVPGRLPPDLPLEGLFFFPMFRQPPEG